MNIKAALPVMMVIMTMGMTQQSLAKAKDSKPFMASSKQILQLSPHYRAIYLRQVSHALLKIERALPKAQSSKKDLNSYSFIEQLLTVANASASDIRCTTTGHVVRGTKDCNYVSKETIRILDEKGVAQTKTLDCGSGQALCASLVYGLDASGNPRCVPQNSQATVQCDALAFGGPKESKEVKLEKMQQTATSLTRIHAVNGEAWEKKNEGISAVCGEDFKHVQAFQSQFTINSRTDLESGCQSMRRSQINVSKLVERIEIAKKKKAEAKAAVAESSSTVPTPTPSPRAAAVAQAQGSEEVAIYDKDEMFVNAEEEAFSEVAVEESPAESKTEEVAQVRRKFKKEIPESAKDCDNINLKGDAALGEAACLSCAIQATERRKARAGDETALPKDFKISQKWMGLLAAASATCGKSMDAMVKEFGYCEEQSDWTYSVKDETAIDAISKLKADTLVNERKQTGGKKSFSTGHHVTKTFKQGYGIDPYLIPDLFCGNKDKLREGIELLNSSGYKNWIADTNREGHGTENLKAVTSLTNCAQTAIKVARAKGTPINPKFEFLEQFGEKQSFHSQNQCSMEVTTDFKQSVAQAESKNEAAMAYVKSGSGHTCQVILEAGDEKPDIFREMYVFNSKTGETEETYGEEFVKDTERTYLNLACQGTDIEVSAPPIMQQMGRGNSRRNRGIMESSQLRRPHCSTSTSGMCSL